MKWSLACHDAICIPCKYMRFNSQCRNQTGARGTYKTIHQIWNCVFSFLTAPIFIKPQFSQTNNSCLPVCRRGCANCTESGLCTECLAGWKSFTISLFGRNLTKCSKCPWSGCQTKPKPRNRSK